MKICVTARSETLNALVDPRFGRSEYLLFVDSDTMGYTAVPNRSVSAMGGAGIETARTIIKEGAQLVITGDIGPNAAQVLAAAGIQHVLYAQGTAREVVEDYKNRQK